METVPPKTPIISVNQRKIAVSSSKKKSNVIVFKSYVLTTKTAVKLLLNGKLKSKVCRYCLRVTNPLSELDQIMQIDGKTALYKVTIRDIVASVHPFKVAEDPNLPNKICEMCLNKAIKSYFFAQQCEQSERALRNCFDDMYEKLDKLDPLEKPKKRGRHKLNLNHNILYTEHRNVIDYAEPIRNLINVSAVSLTKEPAMSDLECKKCWQVLPNIESLANHEKIHPKSMWFNCRICGKSFSKKMHMKRHLHIHAKGKILELRNNDSNFVCKQCGHSTENHNLHLQHIEKHKFHTVLEHLVERKMDKLCSVCLNGSSNMIEMNKIICLHGGYPELTGDRTLYNILGATVPEPNHKYQELHVPHKPVIMKIAKKSNQLAKINTDNQNFTFPPPKIVTLEKINHTGNVFIFSAPETSITNNQLDLKSLAGLTEHDINDNNKPFDADTEIASEFIEDNTEYSAYNNQIIQNNDDKEGSQYNLAEPDDIEAKKIPEVANIKKYGNDNSNEIKLLCTNCWIFNKPMCGKCFENKDVTHKDNSDDLIPIVDEIPQANTFSSPCKYCWIFKHTVKCEYCKMSTPETIKDNHSEKETQLHDTFKNNNMTIKSKAMKRKLQTENDIASIKNIWRCNVCLTTNNSNRDTCVCCQSERAYKEQVKLNFSYNFSDFMKTIELEPNVQDDENHNRVFELTDSVSGQGQSNNIKMNQELTIESMDLSNSPPRDSEIETCIPNEPKFEENMEIAIEEEYTSCNIANLGPVGSVVTSEFSRTSIQENVSAFKPNDHPFYLNPFSLGLFSVSELSGSKSSLNEPQNDLQFNIGTKDDRHNHIRNFRKSLKRQKATRK